MDTETYKRKLSNRLSDFSGNLMNNSKWIKLFRLLGQAEFEVKNVRIESIWKDENPSIDNLRIEQIRDFEATFHNEGIKDVITGGPMSFKEIYKINIQSENIIKVERAIEILGSFEKECTKEGLVVYGYK